MEGGRWPSALATVAGLMGAAGVAMRAAAAHLGGDLAATGGDMLLVHAATVLAAIGLPAAVIGRRAALAAGSVLAGGTSLFALDLGMVAFAGLRPFPLAAPIGGLGMIAGWLLLAGGVLAATRRIAGPPVGPS